MVIETRPLSSISTASPREDRSPPLLPPAAPAASAAPRPINGVEDLLGNYDPATIARFYQDKFLQVLGRCLEVVWPILTLALALLWDKQTGRVKANERRRAVRMREVLTDLGPAFIKIGQALSTRPDLLPPVYLEEMTRLQDQLPAFPNEIAFGFIQDELGAHPRDIYAELTPDPVSAASLGQVYKGKLKTGEAVAVKVQRPGLAESITQDLYILHGIASWLMKHRGDRLKSDLVAIADEFGERIFDEMDYSQEGRNAERFAALYGYLPDIYVPSIYWDYTGRRVLTMEWITGYKLTEMEAIKGRGLDPTQLIEIGVQCSLRQLLEHGFFHADPHPGNLLAMPDGRLAYLDFGMMSEIQPYQRYGLIEAVVHLVNRDFESLGQDYIKLDFLTPDTDLRPIIPALAEVFNNALGSSVAELNFKSMTDQLSALMYEYPFRVPAYYALIIRSLVTLEGIAITVDPEFKVLSKAYPYISKRLLTDPAPQLRASLQDLLFKDGEFRWNRLENLLTNARSGGEAYDMELVVGQTLTFLESERGAFIRDRLVDELVNSIDALGRSTVRQFSQGWRGWLRQAAEGRFGAAAQPDRSGTSAAQANAQANTQAASAEAESLARIQRILAILRDSQGFDPMKVLPLVPRLLAKPEVQSMGQKVAGSLAQKAAARFIREVLLASPVKASPAPAAPQHPSAPTRAAQPRDWVQTR
ncbi:MAG: AarF/ABC1/UbiB kinase family protein [Synechococcales cyanobacterium RM1_1_8]|nr:AarF/ABC1/UbiB kinase family protein [Synechococcales cyanobacterium RM1_1_8]